MLKIIEATTPAQFDTVCDMCWEYRDFLMGMGPDFVEIIELFYAKPDYEALLQDIEIKHARPGGTVKLALHNDTPVGCGMSHSLEPGVAEIKRVYIREDARGLGAGRTLMEVLVQQLRADGFTRILMDTGLPQVAAQKLYLSMGFRQRGPYSEMPPITEGKMVFFEMDL
ncbi:GNAT family N-acetyltransferase [uncultured Shimia sp.]|uniref:GNAT family N-acetyltransferase n=1 Tax=uncultured Shimia sp. TaxID=573152 RepID=UPI002618B33A|nr:GNAT family N-acetyltransferase [uncultured Shimia sp.]